VYSGLQHRRYRRYCRKHLLCNIQFIVLIPRNQLESAKLRLAHQGKRTKRYLNLARAALCRHPRVGGDLWIETCKDDRGRKSRSPGLPSLRTGQADFPHPALQLVAITIGTLQNVLSLEKRAQFSERMNLASGYCQSLC